MQFVNNFKNLERYNLWETSDILHNGKLAIHESVVKIVLIGSRGLLGGHTEESDIDIGLVLDTKSPIDSDFCSNVLMQSLSNWQSKIRLDLTLVFDQLNCGLKCCNVESYTMSLCSRGVGCMGLYKINQGFMGFKSDEHIHTEDMYPIITIWESPKIIYQQLVNG